MTKNLEDFNKIANDKYKEVKVSFDMAKETIFTIQKDLQAIQKMIKASLEQQAKAETVIQGKQKGDDSPLKPNINAPFASNFNFSPP